MNPEIERVKEDLAEWLFFRDWDKEFTTMIYFSGDWQGLEEIYKNQYRKEAAQILSIDGIAVLADDQSLPLITDECVDMVQQEMLTPDSEGRRWVKIAKKEEK